MFKKFQDSKSAGFTLIELMVVVAIIAILSLVVVTNLGSARAKARDAQITQNLHEVDNAAQLIVVNNDPTNVAPNSLVSPGTTANAFNQLVLLAKSKSYMTNAVNVVHPVSGLSYEAEFQSKDSGATLNSYRLCAQLSTTAWAVSENGSAYTTATGATDPCTQALPSL